MQINRTYKKNMRARTILSIILSAVLVCIMIMIFIFFSFKKYIVYTPDGLYLDVPWLRDESYVTPTPDPVTPDPTPDQTGQNPLPDQGTQTPSNAQ